MMNFSIVETKMTEGPSSEDEVLIPKSLLSTNRHFNTTAEDLSEMFQISVEQAQMTLDATKQHHARLAMMLLSRRCQMDRTCEVTRLRCEMSSDTMDLRCKGIHGSKH